MTSEKITFSWWNSSLSPSGKARPVSPDFEIAKKVIDHLLNDLEVDFLVLGEIAESDIESIRQMGLDRKFSIHSGLEPVGRSRFSTCYVVNQNKLEFFRGQSAVVALENSNYRLAQTALLIAAADGSRFHFAMSHWPSRLHCAAKAPIRATLGDRLRQHVDMVFAAEPGAHLVLVGDYNDEPFDESLSDHLRATRDRDLIRSKPNLMYNPFWRHLCHPVVIREPTLRSASTLESWGTYHHRGGRLFRWRTFDQMMFSAKFLTDGPWHLNEGLTGIVDFAEYTLLVSEANSNYDHLPIISTIQRTNNGRL